jgi:RiboL-PSP-HEPN
MAEREEIELMFHTNLERVRGLVALYETLAPEKPGRRPVPITDLLRAAVVFLHATLEDLLRSTLEWKLPSAPGDLLKGIPLTGMMDQKFTLSELAEFRGETVDSVVARSVKDSLARSNFNNVKDVVDAIRMSGIDLILKKELKEYLASMMNRRHLIAHRADRNPSRGAGHQVAISISASSVKKWFEAVKELGESALKLL